MRTTLDLDEDILRLARHLAKERDQSLGRVFSELARQGIRPNPLPVRHGEIPVLAPKPGARPVTASTVKDLLESDLLERDLESKA